MSVTVVSLSFRYYNKLANNFCNDTCQRPAFPRPVRRLPFVVVVCFVVHDVVVCSSLRTCISFMCGFGFWLWLSKDVESSGSSGST